MTIDELLVSFGIDADTQSLQAFVAAVASAAQQIADRANDANDALNDVGDSAANAAEDAGRRAEEAERPLSKLKLIAAGVIAVIGGAAAGVMSFVNSGIAGAKELAKEKGLLYNITKQELKQADEYSKAMNKTGLAIQSIKTKIALNLAPALTNVTHGFNDWLKSNKDLITNGLTAVIKWGGKVIQVIVNAIQFINKIVSVTIGWKAAIMVVVAALAIFKRAMLAAFLTNPIGWVILAIGGLLLLIDDLMVYLKGGKSMFGSFWAPAIKWVKEVITWFKRWYESSKGTIDRIKDIFSRMFSGLWTIVSNFFSYLKNVFMLIYGLLTGDTDLVKKAWQGMTDAIEGMWEGVKTYFSAWLDWLKVLFDGGMAAIAAIWEGLKTAVKNIFKVLGDLSSEAVDSVKETFSNVIDFITSPFQSAINIINGLFGGAEGEADIFISNLGKSFAKVIDFITAPFKAAFAEVISIYNNTVGKISGAWESVKGGAGGALDTAKSWFGLGDATSAPNPQNSSSNVNNRSETTINGGDVNAQITINAANADEARKGTVSGLNAANKRATANLQGAVAG